MNFTVTSQHNLDEIVFENRNKLYGAYALRKAYPDHLVKSFLIAFASFLLLYLITEISSFIRPSTPVKTEEVLTPFQPMTDYVIQVELPPLPKNPQVSLQPKTPSEEFKIEPDKKGTESPVMEVKPVGSELPSTRPVQGSVEGPQTGLVPSENPEVSTEEMAVVNVADEMPEFPGGESALHEYLKNNIEIPREAELAQITGKVLISFVVEPDGSITSVNIERSRGFGLDDEAARVVKKMPKWKPGIYKNKKVRVKFFLPIFFDF